MTCRSRRGEPPLPHAHIFVDQCPEEDSVPARDEVPENVGRNRSDIRHAGRRQNRHLGGRGKAVSPGGRYM